MFFNMSWKVARCVANLLSWKMPVRIRFGSLILSGMEGAIIEGIRESGVEQSEVTIATMLDLVATGITE